MDKLTGQYLAGVRREAAATPWGTAEPTLDDGLESLRRRVRAIALGGRHGLPPAGVSAMAVDAHRLKSQMQPTAASLLANLAQSSRQTTTSIDGVRFPSDPGPLAQRWLACAAYQRAAELHHQRQIWVSTAQSPL
ncbi:MAG: hypothetical protein QGG36_14685 [Pirellulaceae bacterium]|nr:hypothetical protein [Pirellulaceae bacterium]MDP7017049.1 hypothetical protein [Pirellulaceae bacterium]